MNYDNATINCTYYTTTTVPCLKIQLNRSFPLNYSMLSRIPPKKSSEDNQGRSLTGGVALERVDFTKNTIWATNEQSQSVRIND